MQSLHHRHPAHRARAGARRLAQRGDRLREENWERIDHFLGQVVPVATAAKVRLACHPHDPYTPPGYRGVTRVLGTVAGLKRFVTMHESPYHGLNFCQGTVAEMLDDPAREIFRHVSAASGSCHEQRDPPCIVCSAESRPCGDCSRARHVLSDLAAANAASSFHAVFGLPLAFRVPLALVACHGSPRNSPATDHPRSSRMGQRSTGTADDRSWLRSGRQASKSRRS